MLATHKQILKWVYYICIGQFVLILLSVLFWYHPVTKASMTLVGASAIFGLLFSEMVRRNLELRKEISEKKQRSDELEETLKKICDGKEDQP